MQTTRIENIIFHKLYSQGIIQRLPLTRLCLSCKIQYLRKLKTVFSIRSKYLKSDVLDTNAIPECHYFRKLQKLDKRIKRINWIKALKRPYPKRINQELNTT